MGGPRLCQLSLRSAWWRQRGMAPLHLDEWVAKARALRRLQGALQH